MNKLIKYGLLLQIPNVIILSFILGKYLSTINISMPTINIRDIGMIIFYSILALVNIASLVLIILGITNHIDKKILENKSKIEQLPY